jgi:hypothetical protein
MTGLETHMLHLQLKKMNFILVEEEELIEIQTFRTLQLKHSEISLDSFWILIKKKYPNLGLKVFKI